MVNGTSLAVSESSFTNNTALTGGGIYMSRITETYIYDSYFYHNNVTQEGGGVFASKFSKWFPFVFCHMNLYVSGSSAWTCAVWNML